MYDLMNSESAEGDRLEGSQDPGGLCRRLGVECAYREPLPTK